jgi:Na+/phosphate symporter
VVLFLDFLGFFFWQRNKQKEKTQQMNADFPRDFAVVPAVFFFFFVCVVSVVYSQQEQRTERERELKEKRKRVSDGDSSSPHGHEEELYYQGTT